MNVLDSYRQSKAAAGMIRTRTHDLVLNAKMAGVDLMPMGGGFGQMASTAKDRRRETAYRGWLYAAINALAMEGAGQAVCVGRLSGATPNPEAGGPYLAQKHVRSLMQKSALEKSADMELEILQDHPLLDSLQNPNPIQGRWQFVYSFIASLNLTGWGYIIADQIEDGRLELYSLPTSWVTPIHTPEPFSAIKITNPKNPSAGSDQPPIPRTNFGFAYIPDPSDPLSALAPVTTQANAIAIDQHIQTSQSAFFENGIFPSVVVTVGKDPHPEVGAAFRPRLTGVQRRQVHAAINKVMGGVANYGSPAIVDGLIERIERMSATQNEMGWEKSEDKVADRILSTFAVHKFILGLQLNVGGHAQAFNIKDRFYARVNTFLDMLGNLMTNFAGPLVNEDERTLVWWEKLIAKDPTIEAADWREARKNGDVTKNENRARLGLPADLDSVEETSPLLSTVGGMNGVGQWMTLMGQGLMKRETVIQLMMLFFKIDETTAGSIVGQASQQETIEEATEVLEAAVAALSVTPKRIAGHILSKV